MLVVLLSLLVIQIVSNIHLTDLSRSLVLAPSIEEQPTVILPEHQAHPIHVFVLDPSPVLVNCKVANVVKTSLPE